MSSLLNTAVVFQFGTRLPQVAECLSSLKLENALSLLRPIRDLSQTDTHDWNLLASPVLGFLECQSLYYELKFFKSKRKMIETFEEVIQIWQRKLQELGQDIEPVLFSSGSSGCAQSAVLLPAFSQLLSIQASMVGVYRSLALSSSPPDYDQVLSALLLALADANEHLGGDVLHPLRDLVSAELTIVELLLKAQIGMSQYQFKETMVALTASKQKILSWMSVFSTNSTSTSKRRVPVVIRWFLHYHSCLLNKASLYFYEVLSPLSPTKKGIASELRELGVNFVSIIENAIQKTASSSFCLVLDSSGLKHRVHDEQQRCIGYDCRDHHVPFHAPQGLRSWPVIANFPHGSNLSQHWPNIISLLIDHRSHLLRFGAPLHHTELALKATYIVCALEPRVFLVQILGASRSKRASTDMLGLVSNLALNLRCLPALHALQNPPSLPISE